MSANGLTFIKTLKRFLGQFCDCFSCHCLSTRQRKYEIFNFLFSIKTKTQGSGLKSAYGPITVTGIPAQF